MKRMTVAIATAVLLVLSGCGGTGGDDVATAGGEGGAANPPGEQAGPLDPDAQALVFAECMRDNGVDMPDPAPGQQGLVDAFQSVVGNYDQATLEQAFVACQGEMPAYAQGQQHEEADMLALAECLRGEGLDVSDDPFQDVHSGRFDEAELMAAMEACRDVLVGGGR